MDAARMPLSIEKEIDCGLTSGLLTEFTFLASMVFTDGALSE
jgi:hypothetical protein